MKLTLDLSEAQSFEAVPDDTYACEIAEISEVQKGPKADFVTVSYEIVEGDYAGQMLFQNLMITGKASGRFVDVLNKALGEDYDVSDLEHLEIDTDDLIGARVGVVTKQKEYPEGSGEMRSEVKRILAPE